MVHEQQHLYCVHGLLHNRIVTALYSSLRALKLWHKMVYQCSVHAATLAIRAISCEQSKKRFLDTIYTCYVVFNRVLLIGTAFVADLLVD
jgi:hypothetical protein